MDKAKSLINNFVEERLQGNLNEFVRFDFAQLRGDKKYGVCSGDSFDCDNTNLSKAIYLLLFECEFGMRGHNRPASGWHYFDLGAGNHLLIKDDLYNDFHPKAVEIGYERRPAMLYQRWIDFVLEINKDQ